MGALAEATGLGSVALNELVRVGDRQQLVEVLRVSGDVATLQVFEETAGMRGDRIEPGDVLGTIEERGGFVLKVLVPPRAIWCRAEPTRSCAPSGFAITAAAQPIVDRKIGCLAVVEGDARRAVISPGR